MNNSNNNNENLFWKVFKNKFIINHIWNVLKLTSPSLLSSTEIEIETETIPIIKFNYYEANDVEWILKNKYFTLLKEKVKRNENLEKSLLILHFIYLYEIKNQFNDDLEFYNCIFKNYYKILNLKPYQVLDLVKQVNTFDNSLALKSIVETFKLYKPNIDNFIESFKNGYIEISTYLLSSNFIDKSKKENHINIWRKVFTTTEEEDSNSNSSISLKINEKVQLLNKFEILPPILLLPPLNKKKIVSSKLFKYSIDYPIYKETLGTLLESCYSIVALGLNLSKIWDWTKKQSSNRNTNHDEPQQVLNLYYKEELISPPLTIHQLNEIKNSFTDLDLLTKLSDFKLEGLDSLIKSEQFQINIQKLYKMILPFLCPTELYLNYSFYFIMYKNIKQITNTNTNTNTNINTNTTIGNKQIVFEFLNMYCEIEQLFLQFCNGRLNLQKEYLLNYSNSFKQYGIYTMFLNCIRLGSDIQLLILIKEQMELVSKSFDKPMELNENYIKILLSRDRDYSQSNHQQQQQQQQKELIIFDFLINLNYNLFDINDLFPKRIDLLNHLKLNHNRIYQDNKSSISFDLKNFIKKIIIFNNFFLLKKNVEEQFGKIQHVVKFIIENIQDFNINDQLFDLLKDHIYDDKECSNLVNSIISNPIKLKLLFSKGIKKLIENK